jgi:hypothetical protein
MSEFKLRISKLIESEQVLKHDWEHAVKDMESQVSKISQRTNETLV